MLCLLLWTLMQFSLVSSKTPPPSVGILSDWHTAVRDPHRGVFSRKTSCEDLESRSRWNNARMVALTDDMEASQAATSTAKWPQETLKPGFSTNDGVGTQIDNRRRSTAHDHQAVPHPRQGCTHLKRFFTVQSGQHSTTQQN